MLARYLFFCSALMVLVAGCGEAGPLGVLADKADSEQPDLPQQLEGSYLLQVISSSVYYNSEDNETSTMTTTVRARVNAEADESGSTLFLAPCYLKLPEVSGFEPTLPEETLAQLPNVKTRARVYRDLADGLYLQSDRFAFPIGLDLADPLNDPVPADPDDPAVVDLEKDDEPGATLHIAGFSVYLAARLTFELSGQLEQTDTLPQVQGTLNISMDEQVYGDNIPFIDVAERVAESEKNEELVSEEHRFSLTPITDPLSCDPS